MSDELNELIKVVYRGWRSSLPSVHNNHTDEEALAAFIEGKLSDQECLSLREHLISCSACMEALCLNLKLSEADLREVPEELLERVREALPGQGISIFEIFLRAKETLLEVVNTTGDVLVGQEFVPAPVLRSRQAGNFKDEVTILKDFQDVRIQARVENKAGKYFNLEISVKEKKTQKVLKDLRVSLIREDAELESHLLDKGSVVFEHLGLGSYKVEISSESDKVARIELEIKA